LAEIIKSADPFLKFWSELKIPCNSKIGELQKNMHERIVTIRLNPWKKLFP